MNPDNEKIILKATIFDLKSFYGYLGINIIIYLLNLLFNYTDLHLLTKFTFLYTFFIYISAIVFRDIYRYSEFYIDCKTLTIKNVEWFKFKTRKILIKDIKYFQFSIPEYRVPPGIHITNINNSKEQNLFITFYNEARAKAFIEKAKNILKTYKLQNPKPVDKYSEYNGY
ncbi:MAG: hypothetical protein RLZZ175_2406 [Bacteroidota bacterium]|jgi:hypothetical protein